VAKSKKNILEFHNSISEELIANSKRVRFLVDHWGEDGRHHEAVLRNTIRRFMPNEFEIGTGFIVKQSKDREGHFSSSQIDIIIYSNKYPVLFREGDFVIVTPDSVRAIIEVKANLENQNLGDIIKKCSQNGNFIINSLNPNNLNEEKVGVDIGPISKSKILFNGIFAFSGYKGISKVESIKTIIKECFAHLCQDEYFQYSTTNHIAINENLFYKYWQYEEPPHYLYNLKNLSFTFFISNLMEFLNSVSIISNDYLWFPKDKNSSTNIWTF